MKASGRRKKPAIIFVAIIAVAIFVSFCVAGGSQVQYTLEPFKPRPYLFEQKYADIDGVKVSYIDEGQGKPVVFIHGLGGALDNWDYNIPVLKEKYRCIGIDLPGFGNSDKGEEIEYTIAKHAEVVKKLLDTLDIDKASCAGNSMGGHTCLYFALTYPDRIDKLILVDSSGTFAPGFFAKFITGHPKIPMWLVRKYGQRAAFENPEKFKRSFYKRELKRNGGAGFYNIDDPNVKDFSDRMTKFVLDYAKSDDFMKYIRASILTGRSIIETNLGDRLGEIKAPTLVIWGAKDKIVPIKHGHNFNEKIKGSLMATIEEAGHVPQIERADEFNSHLDRFLSMEAK